MRYSLVLAAVFIAPGVGFGAANAAYAGPAPGATALIPPHGSFERAGWRRNYGYGPYAAPPVVVVPQAVPVVPPLVVQQQPVVVQQPIVVLSPRPASCGEYRYWNGQYCVDARYNRPYLGPRP
jgi:hypothetical protein